MKFIAIKHVLKFEIYKYSINEIYLQHSNCELQAGVSLQFAIQISWRFCLKFWTDFAYIFITNGVCETL